MLLYTCSQYFPKKTDPAPTILTTTYALSLAQYPEMAPYPNESSPTFEQEYSAWRDSLKAQQQLEGYDEGLNPFIIDTMQEFLTNKKGKNVIYSPLNVYMALGMLAEVSDGTSRQQILELLNQDSIEDLRKSANAIWNANYRNDGAISSILASSLWLNDTITYNQETLKQLSDTYYASSFSGTMGDKSYSQAFQNWLSEQTGGLLEDEIKEIELDSETILALASTLNFHAKWTDEFSAKKTTSGTFHTPTKHITCDFLTSKNSHTYYWSDRFSSVALPLENNGEMWFILPDENISLEKLLNDPTTFNFLFMQDKWENQKRLMVNLKIPKFDVTSQLDLVNGLKNLGITDVFDRTRSNFSPLTNTPQDIYVSQIEHDSRVMIDEEGVSAVAYTAIVLAGDALPPKDEVDFIVNRPFLFAITNQDGTPIFVGAIQQP